jgi:hypothetical protein
MASDDSDDGKLPPQGRLTRLRRLAGLSAQLGADVLKSGARRLVGQEPELISKAAAEKLVSTLGELKGAAMKLGQAVSMDVDVLSPEVRTIIARLQNEAPPMSYEQVARVLREELGAPPGPSSATSSASHSPPPRSARCTAPPSRTGAPWPSRCSTPASTPPWPVTSTTSAWW